MPADGHMRPRGRRREHQRYGAPKSGRVGWLFGLASPWLHLAQGQDRCPQLLSEALARRGVAFEQLIFPDEVHGFLLHRNWVAAYEAALDFFERKLKAPIS